MFTPAIVSCINFVSSIYTVFYMFVIVRLHAGKEDFEGFHRIFLNFKGFLRNSTYCIYLLYQGFLSDLPLLVEET